MHNVEGTRVRYSAIAAVLGLALSCLGAEPLVPDRTTEEQFRGKTLQLPHREWSRIWTARDLQHGLTRPEGMTAWELRDNALTCTLTKVRAAFTWTLPADDPDLNNIHGIRDVVLLVSQSSTNSDWYAGVPDDTGRASARRKRYATLHGSERTELRLSPRSVFGLPARLRFEVVGQEGQRVKLDSIRLVQPEARGYLRHEFDVPRGTVWRAMADVLGTSFPVVPGERRLFVNGTQIAWNGPIYPTHTGGVDIAPYLKPGRNCIGLSGACQGTADFPMYLQANIVMASGRQIRIQTDTNWTAGAEARAGWAEPGYDDSSWSAPAETRPQLPYIWFRCWMRRTLSLPAYKGRLVLRNPDGDALRFA